MMRAAPIRSGKAEYEGRNVKREKKEWGREKEKNEGSLKRGGMSGGVKKFTRTVGEGGRDGGEGVAVGKRKGIE